MIVYIKGTIEEKKWGTKNQIIFENKAEYLFIRHKCKKKRKNSINCFVYQGCW